MYLLLRLVKQNWFEQHLLRLLQVGFIFIFHCTSHGQVSGGLPPLTNDRSSISSSSLTKPTNNSPPTFQTSRQIINVLGQKIVFTNPNGYCTLAKSAREVELLEHSKKQVGEGVQIIHVAAKCDELRELRENKRQYLDHFLQIQLIGSNGNFKKLDISREAFLSAISKNEHYSDSKKSQTNLRDILVVNDGRDGNAHYVSMSGIINVNGSSKNVTGLGAFTLINGLPLSFLIYESDGSAISRDQLPVLFKSSLDSLIREN